MNFLRLPAKKTPIISRLLVAVAWLGTGFLHAEDDQNTAPENLIDPSGIVFGLPFGASEQEAFQKFGAPAFFIHLDARRRGAVYGKNFVLLFYEGKFDALYAGLIDAFRVENRQIDWGVIHWADNGTPPFQPDWKLSNGLRQGMNLSEVAALLKTGPPKEKKYRMRWSTDNSILDLQFSHHADRGRTDEAHTLHSILIARKHEGADFWSGSAELEYPNDILRGKMLAGFGVSATKTGIRIRHVYKNSPADKAGIRPGDRIEKIDGQATIGMSTEKFVGQILTGDPHELVLSQGTSSRTVTISKADGATFSGGMLQASLAAFLDVKVGDEAPDLEAVTAAGQKIKLSELRGRPVLINFTATWYQPCRDQAPKLIEAYARVRESGMEFLSVYLDSADTDVRAYAEKLGVTWPVRNDEKSWQGDAAQTYGVSAVPTNILVGKDGKIVSTDFRVPHL